LLADLQFGERKRGRQRGDKTTWNEEMSNLLVSAYFDLKRLHPEANDSDIADLIIKNEKFSGFKNPDTIRKKLSGLRQQYETWADDPTVWNSVWAD
jgi:hypothetical protein